MKPLTFITHNFKNLTIAVLVIFALLLLKECHSRNKRLDKAIAANVKLEQQRKADSAEFIKKESRWQDSIRNADLNSDLQVKVIKETEKKLSASQQSVNRLTTIIRNAPTKPDSSFVLVSPQYKDACDSLPAKIDSQNLVIASLKEGNDHLNELMNYETVYRDSLIDVEQEQVKGLNKTIEGKNKIIEAMRDAAKPRGRLLGGISILGNENQFLSGAGVVLAYQTKGGKQYQLSPKFIKVPGQSAELYYEGTVLFAIFK
jgi:hypothetical protein